MAHSISTTDDVRGFVAHALSPAREKPLVLITTPRPAHSALQATPIADVPAIEEELGDDVETYIIATGPLTWELTEQMPTSTEAYGGACRVYPQGTAWVSNPRRSVLHLAHNPEDRKGLTRAVIADAHEAVAASGYKSETHTVGTPVTATVTSVVGGRALAVVDGNRMVSAAPDPVVQGVDAEQLFTPGMKLNGTMNQSLLRVTDEPLPDAVLLSAYSVGDVVLAKVSDVTSEAIVAALTPTFFVRVTAEELGWTGPDGTPLPCTDFATKGEVAALFVAARGTLPVQWTLQDPSTLDTAPADPVPAVSLLKDGPPWLTPSMFIGHSADEEEYDAADDVPQHIDLTGDVPEATYDDEEPIDWLAPVETEALSEHTAQLSDLVDRLHDATEQSEQERQKLGGLTSQLRDALTTLTRNNAPGEDRHHSKAMNSLLSDLEIERDNNARLGDEITRIKAQLRKAKEEANKNLKQLRKAERAMKSSKAKEPLHIPDDAAYFRNAVKQFEFEVYVSWVKRFSADDKETTPLPSTWTLGPDFLDSIGRVDVQRAKVVERVVDVLVMTGNAEADRPRFGWRVFRDGKSGNTVERPDGAVCYRANVESGTAGASRLHVWKLPDGSYEFDNVAHHDDFSHRV